MQEKFDSTQENKDDLGDVYEEEGVEKELADDEINLNEAAFLEGYDRAEEEAMKEEDVT